MTRVRIYEKNFLTKVIARIDFETALDGLTSELPDQVLDELTAQFPILEVRDTQTQEVTLTVQKRQPRLEQTMSEQFKTWRFMSEDKTTLLEIDRNSATYSATCYSRYSEFVTPFIRAIDSLTAATAEPLAMRRVGLRYIDELKLADGDPFDWTGLVSDKLTGALAFAAGDPMLRAMSVLELDFGGRRLRMQYGMPNPDFPARVTRRHFVIDCDAFISARVEKNDLAEELEGLNRLVYDYFERAIGPDLRNAMGIVEEVTRD